LTRICAQAPTRFVRRVHVSAIAVLSEVERLHYVVETQRMINVISLDAESVMKAVVERARAATGADGALVELIDGDEFVTRAPRGITDAPRGARAPVEGLSGLCVSQGVALQSRDCETDPRVDTQACLAAGLRSMIVAPLTYRGQTVGVLKVFSSRHGHFDRADMDVVELMANCIASSISDSPPFEFDARSVLYDPLTGLASRALLLDRLTQVVYEARRYGRSFGIFFLDLNGFTAINQSLGREAGNIVLRTVSRGLSATVRTGDTLARLGGDQFVIVCANADRTVEDRIRRRIDSVIAKAREELAFDGFELSPSIGVLWSTGGEANADNLLSAAMASMYRAKHRHTDLAS